MAENETPKEKKFVRMGQPEEKDLKPGQVPADIDRGQPGRPQKTEETNAGQ